MKKFKTPFKDLLIVKSKQFYDTRGYFKELFKENLIKKKFVFNVVSTSKKNVIRGLHFQSKNPQGKFISVVKGKIWDVVVDLRKNSKTYGKHFNIILSDKNETSIFIPEGFAHGFASLAKENIVVYSCTNYRNEKSEKGILWNDKQLKIKWPIKRPIISKKDLLNPTFIELFKNDKK
jgi:dTDP-4-dehydrorhamnose 3,5-epimerase|tara:strand:- start:323 stop:853 length:531 start_codon:yes stop_codon:yes gene_type:complete